MKDTDSYKTLVTLAKDFDVLYVEDNPGLQEQLKKIFGNIFRKVTVAKNEEEGLIFFKKEKPQVVVSDIKKDKFDGLMMVKKIKAMDNDAKIVIISSLDDKEYLKKLIDIGVNKYLKKPITLKELVAVLVEIVKKLNQEKRRRL